MKSSVWLRPAQIFGKSATYELFDGINPDDVKQGSLGVCYYLATISSLAERDWRIIPLFPFYSKELGFYVIRLLVHGKPTNIPVDDFIPCFRGTNEPLFTKPNGREIWVMILEKAWVKNFGTYLAAEAMSPDTMMEDVTTAPSKGVWIEDIGQEFENLKAYDNQDYIIVLTSVAEKAPKGIVSGHAYSLLSVYEEGNAKLFKIRNPWGSFEWEGTYGNHSKKWTASLEKKVNRVNADDGVFFMTPEELVMAFTYYSVSMVRENYLYSHTEFTSGP
jgi:calpain-15